MIQKRVWVNKIDFGKSYKRSRHFVCDTCAICRCKFEDVCIRCLAHNPEVLEASSEYRKIEYIYHIKYIWTFLLVMNNRLNTPFSKLAKDVIAKIYEFSIQGKPSNISCPVVLLSCNHAFHRHCFQKWVEKRATCPLCNSNDIIPIYMDVYNRYGMNCQITKTFYSSHNQEERTQRAEDRESVQGNACRFLKHTPNGLNEKILYEKIIEKYTRDIDYDIFEYALSELIRKEYIYCIDNVYHYNP